MAKRKKIDEEKFNNTRRLLAFGLKQGQIAEIVGIGPATVSRISTSKAKTHAEWRAEVKAASKAEPKKVKTVAVKAVETASPITDEPEVPAPDLPQITIPSNETADAIRELTSVMRELVAAWEGNQSKKRRIF